MSLVTVQADGDVVLKAIVIETPDTASRMKTGNPIAVLFKETEVIIGTRDNHAISLQNRIPGTINHVEKGALLSRIKIDTPAGEIISIISTNAVSQLGLQSGSEITAMVKLNEMMLSEL